MRADGGALPVDGIGGAADGGREADAVFGVAHVVIHRFRNGDNFDALLIQMRGVAERVVAADGDQIIEFQLFDIFEHLRASCRRPSR